MPRCPNCGKGGFKDAVAVANHMSQPSSGCNTWVDDLVSLRDCVDLPTSASTCSAPLDSDFDTRAEGLAQMDVDTDYPDTYVGPNAPASDPADRPRSESPPTGSQETCDFFPGAAKIFSVGPTFMDKFDADQYSGFRATNLYYPFASREEWELALWLLRSGLSMRAIDSFLKLQKVRYYVIVSVFVYSFLGKIRTLQLSFSTAKELRGRAELLPGGPRWRVTEIKPSHPTKQHVYLYWRDALDCIAWILNHPLFRNCLDWVPRRAYKTPERECRVYTEWMTGDDAWNMQVCSSPQSST